MKMVRRGGFATAVTMMALGCWLAEISAPAQAPSSVAGSCSQVHATNGVLPFATAGWYLFLPATSGNGYQLIGIEGIANSSGAYSFELSNSTNTVATLNDTLVGLLTNKSSFLLPSPIAGVPAGSYRSTAAAAPGAFQEGSFELFAGTAPDNAANLTVVVRVAEGAGAFWSGGKFVLTTAASANTYTITGRGLNGGNSSGNYSYSKLNRSTGVLQINEGVIYLSFSDNIAAGGYALVGAGGWQVGHFGQLDILRQPASQIAHIGDAATFQVEAAGAQPLSYQWWGTSSPIAGATNSSYTIQTSQLSDAGHYSCLVSNSYDTLASVIAVLTVTTNRVLVITNNPVWTNTGIQLTTGEIVTLKAAGLWNWRGVAADFGPEGDTDSGTNHLSDQFYSGDFASLGALLGYVGTDPYQGHWGDANFFPQATGYWLIGYEANPAFGGKQFICDRSGDLWLGFNDDAVSKGIGDNTGWMTVEINRTTLSLRIAAISATTLDLSATGGPGAPFRILATSDLTLPISSWTKVADKTFDSGGAAGIGVARSPGVSQVFYCVASP